MARTDVTLAKLSRPRLHDVLARPRLHALLDDACRRPVAWLAGQPGAGKTTLVADWLKARKRTGIWYQVDPGDHDPASFIYHLQAAAAALPARKAAPELPLLRAEYLADLPGFARRFFRDLFVRLGAGATLVLDNFQEVPEDSAFHQLAAEMMRQVPDGTSVVLISHAEPPAAYATLLAAGAIALVDGAALRISVEETAAIAQKRGISDPAVVEQLNARSLGWAAGLTLLLARSAREGGTVPADDPESLQHVFAWFAQRVYEATPAEQRRMLLVLSFLPRVTPAIAQALAGSDEASRLLEAFYRRHLFTDRRRVGEGRPEYVYQFHALFRSFLQHRVQLEWSASQRQEVAARAGHLLEDAGWGEDALPLLAAAADWEAYARVVRAGADAAISQGRRLTVRDWVAVMPEQELARSPWLGYWQGRSLLQSAPQQALAMLEAAYGRFETTDDRAGQLACAGAVVQALWFTRLGWSEITQWVDRLQPLAHERLAFPSAAIELTSYAALHAALAFCRLDHPAILGMTQRLLALVGDESLDWTQRLTTATHLMTFLHNAGQDALVQQLMGMVDPVVDTRPASALSRAFWYVFRAIHDMRNARDAEASARFQLAEDLARSEGLQHAEFAAMQFRTYLDNVWRRFDDAKARLARMERHPARSNPDAEMNYWLAQVLLAQSQRDVAAAHGHAQRALAAIARVGAAYFEATFKPLLASAFADAGDFATAEALIAGSREQVRGTYLEVMETQFLLEEAYVDHLRGEHGASVARIAQALALAQTGSAPGAYAQRVLSRNRTLLEVALQAGVETAFVRRTIRQWRHPPPATPIPGWPWPIEVRTLGAFEVRADDAPIEFGRKAPRKTLALLKVLVARGGHAPESVLVDTFWPDEAGDAAAKSLAATVHRLRGLLGDAEAVVHQGGQVALHRERVWVDAWAFERMLAVARDAQRTDTAAAEAALALYGGAFLVEEEGESWPVPLRERLRGKFIHAVNLHGGRLEGLGRHEEAIAWYLRGLDADSVVEPFYQGLMRCYARLERLPEAASAYRRLKQTLSITLNLPPSAATEKLYQALRLGAVG